VDQSSPDYASRRGRDRSLQCRFPIIDILFRYGDIRNRSAKSSKIALKKACFSAPNFFWEEPPVFVPSFYPRDAMLARPPSRRISAEFAEKTSLAENPPEKMWLAENPPNRKFAAAAEKNCGYCGAFNTTGC